MHLEATDLNKSPESRTFATLSPLQILAEVCTPVKKVPIPSEAVLPPEVQNIVSMLSQAFPQIVPPPPTVIVQESPKKRKEPDSPPQSSTAVRTEKVVPPPVKKRRTDIVYPADVPKKKVPKEFVTCPPPESWEAFLISQLGRLLDCPRDEILSKVDRLLKPLQVDAQKTIHQPLADLVQQKEALGKSQEEPIARPLARTPWPTPFQVIQYLTSCEQVAVNIPPVGNFWRFYDIQRVQCTDLICQLQAGCLCLFSQRFGNRQYSSDLF